MPLIPEDGTGFANADSLASLEFANQYHLDRGNDRWQVMSVSRREQKLRQATDYIKYIFGPSFAGAKVFPNQSQPFPRYVNGVNIGLPMAIQEAVAELALIADTTPLMPNQTTARRKSIKIGPIEVQYDANPFTGPRFVS